MYPFKVANWIDLQASTIVWLKIGFLLFSEFSDLHSSLRRLFSNLFWFIRLSEEYIVVYRNLSKESRKLRTDQVLRILFYSTNRNWVLLFFLLWLVLSLITESKLSRLRLTVLPNVKNPPKIRFKKFVKFWSFLWLQRFENFRI